MAAETLDPACCLLSLRLSGHLSNHASARRWLLAQSRGKCKEILAACFSAFDSLDTDRDAGQSEPLLGGRHDLGTMCPWEAPCHAERSDAAIHAYERLLQANRPQDRIRHGVYYTPRPLVKFIVRSVHEQLRQQFGLADGLADTTTWGQMVGGHRQLEIPEGANGDEPFVRILDPASGSGAFLVEVVDVMHRTMVARWRRAGHKAAEIARRWNGYVARRLLPRVFGLELMSAPAAIAQINLAAKLAETRFSFDTDQGSQVFVVDTLGGLPSSKPRAGGAIDPDGQVEAAESARRHIPMTVVLGNPPYFAAASKASSWIDDLLRGRADNGRAASYYQADGRPLGERKLWLHDDYVKFIRYGQWRIEQAGCGVLGYVTNHGYLDNPTFRGMRQALTEAFPRIVLVDLHGNRKKKERAPGGGPDQNVFDIAQGLAVGLMCRPADGAVARHVSYAELWGTRQDKLDRLSRATAGRLPATSLRPTAPYYFFVPRNEEMRDEYERGYKLTEIMPVHCTAAVTARDGFVVALEQNQLLARMRDFRDLKISDEEIRRRYFNNGRSPSYPPGDTRGWKLSRARRALARRKNWRQDVTTCLYRPFDRRWVYWSEEMIDWPRGEVMRHLVGGENVALLARRQMPPTQPCNYFWITDRIVLDGAIRSDNRGSESFFPLYLQHDGGGTAGPRRANFDHAFIGAVEQALSLEWVDASRGDLRHTLGPDDLLHYVYALFHCPTYRSRYAEFLRIEFPRIFLTGSRRLLRALCRRGQRLVSLHLLKENVAGSKLHGDATVARGFPKYSGGKVYVNRDAWFAGVPSRVWNYHVGAYQVCRKWLKDRRGKTLSPAEIAAYGQMVAALRQTMRIETSIQRAVERYGGWPAAFFQSSTSDRCSTDDDRCEAVAGSD